MRTFHTNIRGDERGTTAIEFAIVGPVFILPVIGILYLCMCLSVVGSMHYAVEEGARCASVRTLGLQRHRHNRRLHTEPLFWAKRFAHLYL